MSRKWMFIVFICWLLTETKLRHITEFFSIYRHVPLHVRLKGGWINLFKKLFFKPSDWYENGIRYTCAIKIHVTPRGREIKKPQFLSRICKCRYLVIMSYLLLVRYGIVEISILIDERDQLQMQIARVKLPYDSYVVRLAAAWSSVRCWR